MYLPLIFLQEHLTLAHISSKDYEISSQNFFKVPDSSEHNLNIVHRWH